jgi:hypothetical protein
MSRPVAVLALFLSLVSATSASAWHDATHMAVVKAAGLDDYAYLAVGADMAKEKSGGYEDGNHYRNNPRGTVVTADMVLDQVRDYNCRCGAEGHLYGAIIAALEKYRENRDGGKYARYPLGFAAHYLGDLSMPFHNVEYNLFNQTHHGANDGVVEGGADEPMDARVARIAGQIRERMKTIPPIRLPRAGADVTKFNRALADRIAGIANRSIALGYTMQDQTPQRTLMTEDEAYRQLAESAALLKAVFAALQ